MRRAIRFDLSYLSTSKASPNDTGIVIIIIIMIGKLDVVDHRVADYSTKYCDCDFHFLYNKIAYGVAGGGMRIQISELEHGLRLITLNGVLDSNGVYNVEVDFIRHCAEGRHNVLADFSKVSYISSIGLHMLIHTAKLVRARGGKMALLHPQHHVADVLDLVGVSHIIPIYYDLGSARVWLSGR